MATFFENLRNANKLPSWGVLNPQEQQRDFEVDTAYRAAENRAVEQERKQKVKETAPLRDAIKEASGNKIIVDDSIYDKTELERILGSVKDMSKQSGGVFPPGYTIITNSDGGNMPENATGLVKFQIGRGQSWNPIKINFPSDYLGTKNAPYKVYLKNANSASHVEKWRKVYDNIPIVDYNVEKIKELEDDNWIKVENLTHAHELAHTAYFDALKKTQSPDLTLSQKEREKRQNFRNTHASLQELFDIAAKNTGFNDVEEAAATVSGYARDEAEGDKERGGLDASKNWRPKYLRLPEVFAEAYADYFSNKDRATDYSKELIRLFTNYVNDYNKTFNDRILFDPNDILNNISSDTFVNNFRKT